MNSCDEPQDFKSPPDYHEHNHNHHNHFHENSENGTKMHDYSNFNEKNYNGSNPLRDPEFFEAKPPISRILPAEKIIEEFKKRQNNLENIVNNVKMINCKQIFYFFLKKKTEEDNSSEECIQCMNLLIFIIIIIFGILTLIFHIF